MAINTHFHMGGDNFLADLDPCFKEIFSPAPCVTCRCDFLNFISVTLKLMCTFQMYPKKRKCTNLKRPPPPPGASKQVNKHFNITQTFTNESPTSRPQSFLFVANQVNAGNKIIIRGS